MLVLFDKEVKKKSSLLTLLGFVDKDVQPKPYQVVNSFADVVYAVGRTRVRWLEDGTSEYVLELQAMSKKVGMG